MVEPRSRKIKKTLLNRETKIIQHQMEFQNKKKQKLKIQLKKNRELLKSVSRNLKKKKATTSRLLILDDNVVNKAVFSLKALHQKENPQADESVILHFKLKNQIQLDEKKSIMIPLAYPFHYSLKVIFIIEKDETEFRKQVESSKQNINYEVESSFQIIQQILKFTEIEKKQVPELLQYLRKFHLRLVDISVFKKFIMKTKFQKSQSLISYPFNANIIPFEIRNYHKIEQFSDYLKLLTKSAYVYLFQEKDYQLEVASIKMKASVIIENIKKCIYELVPHIMIHSQENHVMEIKLQSDNSQKILIYENL